MIYLIISLATEKGGCNHLFHGTKINQLARDVTAHANVRELNEDVALLDISMGYRQWRM